MRCVDGGTIIQHKNMTLLDLLTILSCSASQLLERYEQVREGTALLAYRFRDLRPDLHRLTFPNRA